jgi:hypothetical protein
MGQGAKSAGYWRVNNSPTIKRVAERQRTEQKKNQISAGCARLQQRKNIEFTTSRPAAEAELKPGAERTKNKLADKWGTDKSRPYAQRIISLELLEWPGARRGSSRSPFMHAYPGQAWCA